VERVAFEVRADPRSKATPEDHVAQFRFVSRIRDQLTETHRAIKRIRRVKGRLEKLAAALGPEQEEVEDAAQAVIEKLSEIERSLYQTKNRSRQDPLNFPIRLNDKLAGLMSLASRGDFGPTRQARTVGERLSRAVGAELAKLARVWEEDLPALNRLAAEHGVPFVKDPRKKRTGG